MARFEPKTYSTIRQRIINRVVARTELTDVEVGGNVETIASAVARELDDLSFQTVNLQKLWDIDTATGEDLDLRAEDYNPDEITRRGATFATGSVVFSRTSTTGTITIPAGTTVSVVDGGPEFVTTAVGTITNGNTSSGVVAIQASETGEAGNVDAGAITQFSAVAGVETVTNAANTTGGQTAESDAEFRQRLKTYARSLARGTPDALKFAVLSAELPNGQRVVTANVIELDEPNLGKTEIYIDNGLGTVSQTATATTEVLVASATGGETRLFLANVPLAANTVATIRRSGVLPTFVTLTEGVDYTLDRTRGQVTFLPSAFPNGLSAGDSVNADYTYYTGLIAEAQKIVDGDPNDRANYPGYRAAGTRVAVLPPTIVTQTIACSLVIADGFDAASVRADVEAAIVRYVNSLGINDDVIFTSLVAAARSITGVFDAQFSQPTANVAIGATELARTSTTNLSVV